MGTGSSDCYIDQHFADTHSYNIKPISGEVTFAETLIRMLMSGQCSATLVVKDNDDTNVVNSDGIQNFKNRFSFELYLLLTGSLIFITKV